MGAIEGLTAWQSVSFQYAGDHQYYQTSRHITLWILRFSQREGLKCHYQRYYKNTTRIFISYAHYFFDYLLYEKNTNQYVFRIVGTSMDHSFVAASRQINPSVKHQYSE